MTRHAFLIIAHAEPRILSVLLQQLDHPGFDVYLHIDAKAPQMQKTFAGYSPQNGGGFCMLQQHVDVRWGDIGQVEVEMLLLRTAAQHGPYAYYHILSGVDLLLKTPDELCRDFAVCPYAEYVNFWHSSAHQRDLKRKIGRVYFFTRHMKDKGTLVHALASFLRNAALAVQKLTRYSRPVPDGLEFRKGSNWASITEDACRYVLLHEPQLHRRLHRSLCPDQIFLQTLLWNSPFRDRILRPEAEDTECSTLRRIDWQRGSPYTWTERDVDELLGCKAVFARKFSSAHWGAVEVVAKHTCRSWSE